MLTINGINMKCSTKIRQIGCDLYNNGAVYDIEIEEYEEDNGRRYIHNYYNYDVEISARVKYQNHKFAPSVYVNEEEGKVVSYDCQCPQARQYGGFCSHCYAVAYAYLKKKESGEFRIARKSSPGIKAIIENYAQKGVLEVIKPAQFAETNLVHLEPELELISSYQRGLYLGVSFKISRTRKYVLKNIDQFIRAIEEGERVKYGKELEFTHVAHAFDETSREWIKVMQSCCNSGDLVQYMGSYRYICVEGMRLDFVFEHFFNESVLFKTNVDDKATACQVLQKRPNIKVELKDIVDGTQLKFDLYDVVKGEMYYYFFRKPNIYVMEAQGKEKADMFLEYLGSSAVDRLFIADKELPVFVEEVLPTLKTVLDVDVRKFNQLTHVAKRPDYAFYLSMPQMDTIHCKAMATYPQGTYNLFEEVETSKRNKKDETKITYILNRYFNAFYEKDRTVVSYQDEAMLYALLTEGIATMQEVGEVYISDEIQKLRVKQKSSVRIGVSMQGNLLELQMQSQELTMEELAEVLSKYDKRRKYVRLKSGVFLSTEDDTFATLAQLQDNTKMSFEDMEEGVLKIPAYRALYLDQLLKENREGIVTVRDKGFKEVIRNIRTVEDSEYEVPVSLQSILRPYQRKGYRWLKTMNDNHFGCILADDMGLGKTLQVIAFFLSEHSTQELESLIVCPASLVYNWQSELEKFAPELPVEVVVGEQTIRKDQIENAKNGRIIITSYDLVRRDIEYYSNKRFAVQVIDEAQYIKNQTTQVAKAVKVIQADFKVALTGTPIENRLSELWSIFDYLMPDFLYKYQQFRREFEVPIVQNEDKNVLAVLQKMITPFILRRTKKEVLKDLPEKIEEVVTTKMTGEQELLYQAHVQRLKMVLEKQTDAEYNSGKIEVLAELTKLRQLCCHPRLLYNDYKSESVKLELCMHYLKNAIEGGHKILIFSQFTTMLACIEKRLQKADISYYLLTGSTSKEKRRDLVRAFNEDDTSVFCISLKAGGTGLNLTAADIVIHYDPWWNVAVETQATDRAHRIGQTQSVNVYKLVVEDTIEEKIVKLQEKKKELADELLSGENIASTSFDREELLEILG